MKILITTLILTFFLASCSQQRFGGISKVKHPKKTNVVEVLNEPVREEIVFNTSAKKFELNVSKNDFKVEKLTLKAPQVSNINDTKSEIKKEAKKINLGKIFTIPLFPEKNYSQLNYSEKHLQLNQHQASENQASRGWFYYIVVGILFLFLASLLAEGSLIAGIFAIVGLIAIIYGLLALIDVV